MNPERGPRQVLVAARQVRALGADQEERLDARHRRSVGARVREVAHADVDAIAEHPPGLFRVSDQHARPLALCQQEIDDPGADVAGGACDEKCHGIRLS